MPDKMLGESNMTTQLVIKFMWKWLAYTKNNIIRNKGRIEQQKYSQTVQFNSNGDK